MESERGKVEFQQDGAPSHTAKSMLKWLKERYIPIFPHPPSSPDINPIEPVWHELNLLTLKSHLRKRRYHAATMEGLKSAMKEVWDEIELEDVDKYVRWMDHIFDAVLAAHRGHTKFEVGKCVLLMFIKNFGIY
ncbi:hypothetical protein BT96DRAFT_892178 [Gymnopus androsaceus JB14]|uniref:Tc1-like transposase DDE domain-containing protein n=1 Tax=Gymnopus androsaceus JB14 TaxID=1447944 RepID=A0A6A4GI35_9AGAR|nr:hypothetical protein BT96DRAFT_892178 [Gymnopus androsaceus JB14]